MDAEAQGMLLEIPEQPAPAPLPRIAGVVPTAKPKLKAIDREQGLLRPVIVDELVAEDHKVRAIWDLTGELDLSGFYRKIRSKEGKAGSPAWDPRLLLSVWLYAYSEQVTSAREVARLMEYEPGLMWLSGLGEVNYHKLSEFRAEYPEELRQLMAELPIVMVTHDPVVARLADRRIELHHGKIAAQEVFAMADEEQFDEIREELFVLPENGQIAESGRMEVHGALPVSIAVEKLAGMELVTTRPHPPESHDHKPFVNPCHDA